MEWYIKKFEDLTNTELFEIYKLRSEVFIVEQNCPYNDVDEKDKIAFHIYSKDYENDNIISYGRIFLENDYVHIGRVIVNKDFRSKGLGRELLKKLIYVSNDKFANKDIFIEAQARLQKFYEEFNFKAISETFLLDGIPHIEMILKNK